MLRFKISHDFQKNDVVSDPRLNVEINPTGREKEFFVFNYFNFTDVGTGVEKLFFPVFMRSSKPEKKEQLDLLYKFVQANKTHFLKKKLTLLLLDPLEAPPSSDTVDIDDFAKSVKSICKKVYYIDGNKKFKSDHVTHFYCEHWIKHALSIINQPADIIPLEDEHKTYIFLNKRIREHRAKLMSEIVSAGLRKDGYVTWTGETGCFLDWASEYPNILSEKYDILDFEDVMTTNPTDFAPIEYCKKSFLFLNTETYTDNDRLFITEKSYKPLRIGMPFMTLSHPGTLEELRSMGFQTFSKWIDESYDTEENIQDRVNIIISELNRFAKMTNGDRKRIREEMIPILKYNQELVMKLTVEKHDLINILEELSEIVKR